MRSAATLLICLALLAGPTAAPQAVAAHQAPVASVVVAGWEPAFSSPAQTEPFPLYRTTLPNGLQLWVQPRPGSQSVAALLVLRAGARYESAANNGVSHFVEHMVFTGTERWSEEEVKDVIAQRGGRWNGWTSLESTGYWAHVASGDLDVALDWLAQVVFHPTFPADKVDKERQVIFQEKWGRYGWIINTLDALGFGYELERTVRRALFPGSTLGLRVVGEDASLDSLDREALLDYYQQHYTPKNAALVVVGGIDPQQVLGNVKALFGPLEGGERPAAPETPPLPSSGPQQVAVRGPWPTDQVQLMVGARTVGRLHPDRWALEVLAEVLDTELTQEIRYQQGLVYGLWAYNIFFDDTGYLVIETSSGRESWPAIRRTAEARLQQFGRGEIDAQAIAEAKAALQGRWRLRMEDNLERASWLAGWSSALAPGEAVPDAVASLGAVTVEQVSHVVATYYTPRRRYVGLHLPVLTVVSGAWLAAGFVVIVAGGWLALRLRRRARDLRRQP